MQKTTKKQHKCFQFSLSIFLMLTHVDIFSCRMETKIDMHFKFVCMLVNIIKHHVYHIQYSTVAPFNYLQPKREVNSPISSKSVRV